MHNPLYKEREQLGSLTERKVGTRERSLVKSIAVFAEDICSSPDIVAHNHLYLQVKGIQHPALISEVTIQHVTHTFIQANIYTHYLQNRGCPCLTSVGGKACGSVEV